jgi:SAM-dependent methyltransferase
MPAGPAPCADADDHHRMTRRAVGASVVQPTAGVPAKPDRSRRAEVLGTLADAAASIQRPTAIHVAVDALDARAAAAFADELAGALVARGRRCRRASLHATRHPDPGTAPSLAALRSYGSDDLVIVDGGFLQNAELAGAWDLVVFLRSDPAAQAGRAAPRPDDARGQALARYLDEVDPEATADVAVDLHDPAWPVIRRVAPGVAQRLGRDLHPGETRAFFAPRAATWDQRFPDDDRAYAAAVGELGLRAGQAALDLGCGTGRALPHLRRAVGPGGAVLGLDLTPEMLAAARRHGRDADALLVLADARRLPLRSGSVDAAFAAGLLPHLPDPAHGLTELARVVRPGGQLALFHPSGRVALATRHGRRARDSDLLGQPTLRPLLERTGWQLDLYDDAPHRFLALALRTSQPG